MALRDRNYTKGYKDKNWKVWALQQTVLLVLGCSPPLCVTLSKGAAGPAAASKQISPSLRSLVGRRRLYRAMGAVQAKLRMEGPGAGRGAQYSGQCRGWRCCSEQEPKVRGPLAGGMLCTVIPLCNKPFLFSLSDPSNGLSILYFKEMPALVSLFVRPRLGISGPFWPSHILGMGTR